MTLERRTLGGLDCQTYDELPQDAAATWGVVFCHGFGAPANDLVPLAPALLRQEPILREHVRFLFPGAPLSLDSQGMPGGRAWWPLDIERLIVSAEQGEFRDLIDETPKGLEKSREMLFEAIEQWRAESGLEMDRIVLGGFSQGAMIATDVALQLTDRPAGLCIFSGTPISAAAWRDRAALRGTLPVIQSHGRQDPVLPFAAAEFLRDLLLEAGLAVDFLPFEGEHTIPQEAIARTGGMLLKLVTGPDAEPEAVLEAEAEADTEEQTEE